MIVQEGQVALDHRSFDLAGRHVVEPEDEVGELTQIAHVGFDGILREPFFQFDINAVTTADFFPFFESFCHFYLSLQKIGYASENCEQAPVFFSAFKDKTQLGQARTTDARSIRRGHL